MPGTLLSINNYFYPRGGAETVFLRHNEMLEAEGWSVVPFCMQHDRNRASPWSEHFVDEIELGRAGDGPLSRARKGLKAVYSLEARRKLSRVIDRLDPDVCHAHNVYHHISPSILGAIRRRGIPLVMTLHDLKIACPAYSMLTHDGICERCRGGRLFHVVTNRCMKGSLALSALVMAESYLHRFLGSYTRNVDRFIVPSRFYLDKLTEWGFDAARFDYLPNFVDADAFEPRFEPGKRFVYFGRLSREKGLKTLIEAATEARVGLDLVGTGPLEAELRSLAERRGGDVEFRGFLSGEALWRAVASARAVVAPSEWYENAPLSVLEACALGKPVIVAAIGGLPELIADGESGWTFAMGSVDALTMRLRAVADLPDSAVEAAGAAARDRVTREFSAERYLDQLRAIYRRLGVAWH
jgi:glycosyltransferase involved in cell wall biosynthesis